MTITKEFIIDLLCISLVARLLFIPYFSQDFNKNPSKYDHGILGSQMGFTFIIFILMWLTTTCATIIKGGEYMVIEIIFLMLIFMTIIIRYYSVNRLSYMKVNRIYDDKIRKLLNITFLIADYMLFILVIAYIFIKAFTMGIF